MPIIKESTIVERPFYLLDNQGYDIINIGNLDINGDLTAATITMTGFGVDATGVTNFGRHIILDEQALHPAVVVSNKGIVYTYDVAGVTELFYQDSTGANTQLTGGGSLSHSLDAAYDDGRIITVDAGAVELFANAGLDALLLRPEDATAISTIKDSPNILLRGKYWTGAVSADYDAKLYFEMQTVGPTGRLYFDINGSEVFSVDEAGNAHVPGKLTVDGAVSGNDFTVGNVLDASAQPSKPKIYSQLLEPDIPNDAFAFWRDTTNNKTYMIIDRAGVQEKVQLS